MPARQRTEPREPRIGLALAGGGPEGAVYEVGALRALEEAISGFDANRLAVYVGVSAGAFVASCLANGITIVQMCRAIASPHSSEHPFRPGMFFTPAVRELLRRSITLPGHLAAALVDYVRHPQDLTLLEALLRLSRALPVGVFDNEPIRRYLSRLFSEGDHTDDFGGLGRKLIVVAADLCSARPACFGGPGLDHVPISRAVQASTALPGLYPPVEIEGRYYVDGVLLKTMHGSYALDEGVELLVAINPIVPVDVSRCLEGRATTGRTLLGGGLPSLLSQTFRTLIHSRMALGWATYSARYPLAKALLFEPDRADLNMFRTNIFSFFQRKSVLEYAYRSTRRALLRRAPELRPILSRHGLRLRLDVLRDERDACPSPRTRSLVPRRAEVQLRVALDRLEALLRAGEGTRLADSA
jgi:NTE family protein